MEGEKEYKGFWKKLGCGLSVLAVIAVIFDTRVCDIYLLRSYPLL